MVRHVNLKALFMSSYKHWRAHLFNEHGQWYGREVGKRERLWLVACEWLLCDSNIPLGV